MHYITEGELRRQYAQEHFDTFQLPIGARLTPSARQFLIDFRINFESLYHKKSSVRKEKQILCDSSAQTQALKDDMRILGARLRLLAHKALGVNNDAAQLLECVGGAWQEGTLAKTTCCFSEQQLQSTCETIPSLPLNACVHTVYFEMTVMCLELLRCIHFWNSACFDEAASRFLDSWMQQAHAVFCVLTTYVEQVKEGTSGD